MKQRESCESHHRPQKLRFCGSPRRFPPPFLVLLFRGTRLPHSTELTTWKGMPWPGTRAPELHHSHKPHAKPPPASPNVVRNLPNLLCEPGRDNCLADSDKRLFKGTFVLLRGPGNGCWVVMATDTRGTSASAMRAKSQNLSHRVGRKSSEGLDPSGNLGGSSLHSAKFRCAPNPHFLSRPR